LARQNIKPEAKHKMKNRTEVNNFNTIPNVGPAAIRYLYILGISKAFELIGKNTLSKERS